MQLLEACFRFCKGRSLGRVQGLVCIWRWLVYLIILFGQVLLMFSLVSWVVLISTHFEDVYCLLYTYFFLGLLYEYYPIYPNSKQALLISIPCFTPKSSLDYTHRPLPKFYTSLSYFPSLFFSPSFPFIVSVYFFHSIVFELSFTSSWLLFLQSDLVYCTLCFFETSFSNIPELLLVLIIEISVVYSVSCSLYHYRNAHDIISCADR